MNKENDLISREALKKAIGEYAETRQDTLLWQADVEEIIDNSPTVDTSDDKYLEERDADAYETGYLQGHIDGYLKAEKDYARPQGEWIEQKNYPFCYECNQCGTENTHKANFCEHCGASMKGGY